MKEVHSSNKGNRNTNEDYILSVPNNDIFIIADGMGGHDDGEYASYFAATTFLNLALKHKEDLEEAPHIILNYIMNTINNEIRTVEDIKKRKEKFGTYWNKLSNVLQYKSMGTTLSALLLFDGYGYICHTGDTRIYKIINDVVIQLTNDYNNAANKNIITSCLGVQNFEYQINYVFLEKNSKFILSTDGLHNYVTNKDLLRLSDATEENCTQLINLAIKNGSDDNVSVIIINT